MRFASAMIVFCGVLVIRTVLPTEGGGIYHITMEEPSPYYSPMVATIPAGYRIQWNNKTATAHTVTHDDCLTKNACAFDSGSVAPGSNFTIPFLEPGSYPYYCRLHPIMRGVVTVIGPRVKGSNFTQTSIKFESARIRL